MKKGLLCCVALAPLLAAAQPAQLCAPRRSATLAGAQKITLATSEEEWYDVKHVALDLRMTHLSTAVRGNVTTTAQVTAATLPVYAFELDTSLTIDSVLLNNQKIPVATSGKNIRKVTLPTPLSQGQTFTAQVFYRGQPPSGAGFFTRGLNHFALSSGTNITYTLGDMYYASEWWPCKQDVRDKIDSTDFSITVPNAAKAGSNGVLTNVVAVSPTETRYEWRHRYPIKYYLISAAVAPYTERSYTVQFAGGDTMRVQNFVYDTAGINTESRNALDSIGYTLNLFSGLFGKYPFAREKYGNCLVPLGGGMEHQTMTSLGYNTGRLVTMHELGHQWWGDCVSQKSWKDIWLSEGFATYCELLFLENADGPAAAQAYRNTKNASVVAGAGGSVIVADTTDQSAVFSSRLVYDKGALVAHMLRYIAPADILFFKGCRQYQQTYRYGHATTADLKAVFETVYAQNLDSFFRQWVYGAGYPTYSVRWNYRNGNAYIELRQAASSPASVALFQMPVEVELLTVNGPQTRRVLNTGGTELFVLPVADSVTAVRLDPQDHLIKRRGAVTRESSLGVLPVRPGGLLRIFPNPAQDAWQIEGLAAHAPWQLTDLKGRVVQQGVTDGAALVIPARELSAGAYLLHAGDEQAAFRLVRP